MKAVLYTIKEGRNSGLLCQGLAIWSNKGIIRWDYKKEVDLVQNVCRDFKQNDRTVDISIILQHLVKYEPPRAALSASTTEVQLRPGDFLFRGSDRAKSNSIVDIQGEW